MTPMYDRHAAERADVDLPTLARQAQVLDLVGHHAPVEDGDHPRLRLRDWQDIDADALLLFLGRGADGVPVVASWREGRPETSAGQVEPAAPDDDAVWLTLRDVGPWLPEADVDLFMAAQGLAEWHRTHGFCPRCGSPTRPGKAGWVRVCEQDQRELYPRTDPAVIMGIRDQEDRLLLARGPQWGENRRSVLAGFVEPGESLEAAVRREVAEEVGVRVGRVVYEGNQPWPFPASLMLGFAGWAETTDIVPEEGEIVEARWFTRAEVADAVAAEQIVLPGRLSIARRLIESWYGERLSVPAVDERGGEPWTRPS